jgi:hypothetical protein
MQIIKIVLIDKKMQNNLEQLMPKITFIAELI